LFVCACEPESYPSDLTDAQWELIAPMVEPRPGGRPATHPRRRIVDAILYLNRTGCSWRQLPHDFPPWETVYWYFKTWNDDGVTDRIHDALWAAVRDAAGRDPMASAGIVDAQSVKGADTVGAGSRGYDAGKKVNGRKRHIVVDTLGLLMVVLVTAANLQDRDGGRRILDRTRMAMPSIALVWADGGYAGKLVAWVARYCRIMLEIVRKPEGQRTFEVPPRRWGGGTNPVLADVLATTRPRPRTPAHPFRSHGQMGHDRRPHGTTPGAPTRTTALATGPCPVNPFPNTFSAQMRSSQISRQNGVS
jgi:transposase